jgi:hypothetical protein
MHQLFILSPANSGGERANLLFSPRARFDLARRLQAGEKLPLGQVFSFLSGLYFRGKFAYAATFSRPPSGVHGAYVITSNAGLLPAIEPVNIDQLRHFSTVPIDPNDERYAKPLQRDARKLARASKDARVVLLGSIGTNKYAELLMENFGARLHFPSSFVGRGDMSRGGLLLRAVSEKQELAYIPISGAVRHGKRPEKLPPRSWGYRVLSGDLPVVKK